MTFKKHKKKLYLYRLKFTIFKVEINNMCIVPISLQAGRHINICSQCCSEKRERKYHRYFVAINMSYSHCNVCAVVYYKTSLERMHLANSKHALLLCFCFVFYLRKRKLLFLLGIWCFSHFFLG